jgi:hypothetical protein
MYAANSGGAACGASAARSAPSENSSSITPNTTLTTIDASEFVESRLDVVRKNSMYEKVTYKSPINIATKIKLHGKVLTKVQSKIPHINPAVPKKSNLPRMCNMHSL